MNDRADDLSEAVRETLDRLVRERLARRPGGHLIEAQLREIELRLPLPLDPSEGAARAFSTRLVATIDELLDDAVQLAAAFRPGHVWCHRCESLTCEHSRPPSSRQVFVGYAPTGFPRWEDFAQVCLERKHPRVDQLYDEPPAFLTLVQDGAALQGKMLAAFDNGSYELLGQVVAGFFPVRTRAEEGRGVLALTAQVAASRTRRGRLRLGLNLLGRTPSGDDLERLWDRHEELPWRKAVHWAQSALQTVTPRRGRAASSEPLAAAGQRVERILQGLARRLERDHRARGRRTRHAEERHASGERPTRKALDDARLVASDSLLVDDRTGAVVVLGERGRTHFFTPDGRHVSSVRYSREAIERKLKSELWRRATDELSREFRSKLPS
jgi:hypothetical protein